MTNFYDEYMKLRDRVEAGRPKCKAIGCPKQVGAREDFCLKHWNMLGRITKATIMRGAPDMRAKAIENACELIQKQESRGRDE